MPSPFRWIGLWFVVLLFANVGFLLAFAFRLREVKQKVKVNYCFSFTYNVQWYSVLHRAVKK